MNTPVTSQLQPLLNATTIQERVSALGAQLNADYVQSEAVRVVGVLKGAWIFLADLVRQLDLPISCDFLGVSSYGQATTSSGVMRMTTDLNDPIAGLDVILVEDIVDTGLTMRFLLKTLALREPRSIRTCTLLDKPSRRRVPFTPDYVGFTIPDQFVVGYGLDWAGAYRHLPYIAIWQPQDG
ncbi:hypoxanthine phosphoribosyltransferase [Candidatus Entotheonella palauensis]|uniref:hypoxanthine phosphoribosyltransferase n=1 Tax=Candidatus Entotheonella palauensis TaxID=93172 RepID=UPI0021174582|nr:hypoxanthine phosphoribosyltransferase [Candidatus Entotheonella palauensis]